MNKISNEFLNQIASTSIRLAELFQWVDVDAEGLIDYWQLKGLPSPIALQTEMERNIDEAINRGEMIPYKNFMVEKMKPAASLQEQIKHWLNKPSNFPKDNGPVRVFLGSTIGLSLSSTPLSEDARSKNTALLKIRLILQEIDFHIESLLKTVGEIWKPLLVKPSDNSHKENLSKKNKTEQGDKVSYSALPQLFKDSQDFDLCLEGLRRGTNNRRRSVIDHAGRFVERKGNLSIMIAWFDVVECQGYLIDTISDQQKSSLMNDYFPGLSLDTSDASMWRKPRTEIGSTYHAEFLGVIPRKRK